MCQGREGEGNRAQGRTGNSLCAASSEQRTPKSLEISKPELGLPGQGRRVKHIEFNGSLA